MNEKETVKKVNREGYGTFHYPHGWLGFNYDFSGICPTIDSGIWKHHTLLIEVINETDSTRLYGKWNRETPE